MGLIVARLFDVCYCCLGCKHLVGLSTLHSGVIFNSVILLLLFVVGFYLNGLDLEF